MPGTGISIVPPLDVRIAPAGAALIDSTGDVTFFFQIAESGKFFSSDPILPAIYPHLVQPIKTSNYVGELKKRTRAVDRGGYDGWALFLRHANKELLVTAMYTGNSPERFQSLQDSLSSVRWEDSPVNQYAAAGFQLAPTGMKLVKAGMGALSFNQTGEVSPSNPSLLVAALPVANQRAQALVSIDGCQDVMKQGFPAGPYEAPRVSHFGNYQVCEAWSKANGRNLYVGFAAFKNGTLLQIMGDSGTENFQKQLAVFRAAVANITLLDRQKGMASERH